MNNIELKIKALLISNKRYTKEELKNHLGISEYKYKKLIQEYPELKTIIKKDVSRGNTKLYYILKKLFPFAKIKREFKIYKYKYDFYIRDFNILIEYDGSQHFENNSFFGTTTKQQKLNDATKTITAISKGFNLIRFVEADLNDIEYIRTQIINNSGGINEYEQKKQEQKEKRKEFAKKFRKYIENSK